MAAKIRDGAASKANERPRDRSTWRHPYGRGVSVPELVDVAGIRDSSPSHFNPPGPIRHPHTNEGGSARKGANQPTLPRPYRP